MSLPQVRVALPAHLRTIAKVNSEVALDVAPPVTINKILDALETAYPALQGTIRDPVTGRRRPFIRFFACAENLSLHSQESEVPAAIVSADEPF